MVVLRWLLSCQRAEQGQNLVEFAASLMILLVLTFGLVDAGRLIFVASILQASAEEGARAGLGSNVTDSQIQAAARSHMTGLDPAQTSIAVARPNASTVEVTITYPYVFMAPLVSDLVAGGRVPLTSRARMISH